MRRSSDLVRNRLRQQAGNLNEKTRSLAQPVPYRVRLIEFLGKALSTAHFAANTHGHATTNFPALWPRLPLPLTGFPLLSPTALVLIQLARPS